MIELTFGMLVWFGLTLLAAGLFGASIVQFMDAKEGWDAQIWGTAMVLACGLLVAFVSALAAKAWPNPNWYVFLEIAMLAIIILGVAFWRRAYPDDKQSAAASTGP